MAKRPTDDFDATHENDDWQDPVDDAADFGAKKPATADHDDSDFVADDMSDIVDDADPHAGAHEDDDAHEDDHHDDGDHDFDDEDLEEEAPPEPKRGLSGLVFYAIIAAVVIFGGYMAYKSFMGPKAQTRQVADVSETSKKDEIVIPPAGSGPIPVPPTAPTPEEVASNPGWQTNLHDDTPAPAAAAVPAPVVAVPVPTVSPQVAQSVTALNGNLAEMTNKVAQLSTELATLSANSSQISQTQQVQAASIKALESRPVAVAAPVPGAKGSTTMVAAPDPAMLKDLALLRTQVADLQKQLEAQKATSDAAVRDLKAELARKPAAAASTTTTVTAAPVATVTTPAPVAVVTKTVVKEEPKAKPAKKEVAKPAAKPAKSVAEAPAPRSPKAREAASGGTTRSTWVLRAATPGMAWVSPQPGSAELRRITVGDSLQGIGQVTDIRQEGGRWVVQGSQGSIR